ncbi:MAG: flotillin family protein, partial [Armatimonadota bacterium]
AWLASRYRKAGPDEALIIYGGGGLYRVIVGGGGIVWPFVNQVESLSLKLMTIEVKCEEVYSAQGVPMTVDGIAQIKVDRNDEMIRTAAERFLGKPESVILSVAQQTLEGHLRAIIGLMTVEAVYAKRDEFAQKVAEVAATDMAGMGLRIDSFTIRDVRDSQGYLDALGKPRTAQVKRDATIGEAEAQRDAQIKTAEAQRDALAESSRANRDGQLAKYEADTKIAEANRDYEMAVAQYRAAMEQQKAEADLAYEKQKFRTQQEVEREKVQVEVVEREMQVKVQEQEIVRKQRELEATVRTPADAEKYKITTLAEAEKTKLETEAAGESAKLRQVGEGEATATRAKGLAEAEVIKATGLAEAEVVRQKGFAEAEAMMKKAEAWQNYNQAAITEKVIEVLPAVAAAVAEPLSKTERIVMVNTGGDGAGGIGASRITHDVSNIIAQLPPVVEALSGIDFEDLLKRLPKIGQAPAAPPAESEPEAEVETGSQTESAEPTQ